MATGASYSWSLGLPSWPQVGFQEEIKMTILRTPMDKGISKLRTTGPLHTVFKVNYLLEDYQVLELENFIYNDIKGTLRFIWQHPRSFDPVDVRIMPINDTSYIDIAYKVDKYFSTTLSLHVLPDLVPDVNNTIFGETVSPPYSWPNTLPNLPLRGYSETGNLNIAKTANSIKQRRLGERPGTLGLSYILTGTQTETLVNFITNTIKGTRRFYFPHPRTQKQEQVRLLDSNGTLLTIQHVGTGSGTANKSYLKATSYYSVSLNLEIIP
jgi:hypothetical protein